MIKKLYKYDIKKMSRVLIWFYVLSLSFAVVARLVNIGKHIQSIMIIGKILEGFTYSAIANVLINTVIHILNAFIKGFYRDESYLTHTLPVTKNQLFVSKFLAAITIIIASVLVSVASILILFASKDFFTQIKALLAMVVDGFNMNGGLFLFIIVFLILIEIICMMTMSFTAIIKGNTYNSKRVIKGVIWFFIYYMGATMINLSIIAIVFAITGNISELLASVMSAKSFVVILVVSLIAYVGFTVFHYILANKLFNRGVNVD